MNVTTPENMTKIHTLYTRMQTLLANLHARWEDEKEYEDFAEYEKVTKAKFEEELSEGKFLKMNKRPFGFNFELDGKHYNIRISSRKYEWKRLS